MGNHYALGAIDDEGSALGHHGDLTHVDLFVLDEVFFAKAELHVEGHRIGDALANALDLGVLGVAEGVGDVFEDEAAIVGFDGEHLAENGLKTLGLALFLGDTLLEEIEIRRDLDFDQVRRNNDFTEFAEVDAVRLITDGHG